MMQWLQWAGVLGRFFLPGAVICLLAAPAAAEISGPDKVVQPLTAEQLLVLEAQVPGSEFASAYGFSVALSDDGMTALVGAPLDDCEAGESCGAAQVLVRVGGAWIEQAQLIPSDPAAEAELGTSVALSGDGSIALIGALRADCPAASQCGAAYVFVRSGQIWTQAQKLFASDADGFDFFGQSVDLSLDGSVALVGAPVSACAGPIVNCGAAYVFVRSGGSWIETARLASSSPGGLDLFGNSVSLSDDGTVALIGAPFSGCGVPSSLCGEAYVFVGSGATWTEERRFTNSNPNPIDQFGFSVSLSSDGSVALIGEPSDDCAAGDQCGAAYIFARDGGLWTETAKLTIPDNSGNEFFGVRVSLAGDAQHALIGASVLGPCLPGACRLAYLFVEEDGLWEEKQRLTATRCGGGFLASSVALSENADRALVGVPFSNCPGEPGEAYIFGAGFTPFDIPVASGSGLAVLAIALAAIGAAMLRR